MTLLPAVLVCTLVYLESWPVGQFLLGRPALLLPVLGILGGQPLAGLWLGIVLELLTLRSLPMGAALPPDPALAGVWTLLALDLDLGAAGGPPPLDGAAGEAGVALALLLAVPLCWIAPWLTEAQRRLNGRWWHPRFEAAVLAGDDRRCGRLMAATLAQTALLGAAAAAIALPALRAAATPLLPLAERLTASAPARLLPLPWLLLAVALGALWRHAGGRRGNGLLYLGAGAGAVLTLFIWGWP